MISNNKTLTTAELEALQDYANEHGRNWKQALRDAWMESSEPGVLQALRNDQRFGPAGLESFSFLPDHVTFSIMIKTQTLMDLLCTAVEGGSNYWASFDQCERTTDLDYISVRVAELEVSSGTKRRRRTIKAEDLAIGLTRLADAACAETFPTAAKHLCDALSDHDATTADVVLQMTMFGEIIYG